MRTNDHIQTKVLPKLAKDYSTSKGDLWKLSIRDFFGFQGCVKIGDIEGVYIVASNSDGWNIDSIVTFAVYNKNYWEVTSQDLNVYRWVDNDYPSQSVFPLSLNKKIGRCVKYLYVMAHTSNVKYGGSDKSHKIELQMNGGFKSVHKLPDLPKNDYYPSKGDLWRLSLNTFFGVKGCKRKSDITGIAFVAASKDGWNIESVITYVVFDNYRYKLSSVDLDVNRWVDTDQSSVYKRFDLHLA